MAGSVVTRAVAFYAFCALMILLILNKVFAEFLPDGVATQIGHNSEVWWIAILIGVLVQFVRPAVQKLSTPQAWAVMIVIALICFGIAKYLSASRDSINPAVATWTECFTAAGFIALYINLPRPQKYAVYYTLAMLLIIIAFNRTEFITLQAEGIIVWMLAPISFDVADRGILDRNAEDNPTSRLTWMFVLLVVPIIFMGLYRMHLHGLAGEIARYGRRPDEAFWGLFVVHLYFSYILGRQLWHGGPVASESTTRAAIA